MKRTPSALRLDGYKTSHVPQYPDKTTLVYSNYTARSSRLSGIDSIVFFGLQYWVKKYLIDAWSESFFNRPKDEVMKEIKDELDFYCPLPSYDHYEALHDLGYLPVEVKGVPEGTVVPIGIPCMSIVNTHDDFFWVTNMLETNLSNIMWGAINSATIANEYRKLFLRYANLTCDTTDHTAFQGHDFSYRGMMFQEAAEVSGAAHLTSFKGTDTIPAIVMLRNYYNATGFVAGTVPASEHSVQCANAVEGTVPDDGIYLQKMLDTYPKGIVSIVSDGFDFWKMVTETYPAFKDQIMAREGTVVIRPDSGDPVEIICGANLAYIDDRFDGDWELYEKWSDDCGVPTQIEEHVYKGLIECLWETFGGTINSKGYKVLDSHIGAIYGDAITRERADQILDRLEQKGFAASNIVLGIGSYTYQYNTRDTFGGAIKATYVEVDGVGRNIFKDPQTGSAGTPKKSMKGLIRVHEDWTVDQEVTWEEEAKSILTTMFKDGELVRETNIEEIRELIANPNGVVHA